MNLKKAVVVEPSENQGEFESPPHPWYGSCDAFGGDEAWCSECRRVQIEMAARLAHLDSPEVQEAIRWGLRVIERGINTGRVLLIDRDATRVAALRGLLLPEPPNG